MSSHFHDPLVLKSFILTKQGIEPITLSFTPHYFPFGITFEGITPHKVLKNHLQALFQSLRLSLPTVSLTIQLSRPTIPQPPSYPSSSREKSYLAFLVFPIALGFFVYLGLLPSRLLEKYAIFGLVNPQGHLLFTPGVLPVALMCGEHNQGLICPAPNGTEAQWSGLKDNLIAPEDFRGLSGHFRDCPISPPSPGALKVSPPIDSNKDIPLGETQVFQCREALKKGAPLLFIKPPSTLKKFLLKKGLSAFSSPLSAPGVLSLNCALSVQGSLINGDLQRSPLPLIWPLQPMTLFSELGPAPFLSILDNPFSWSPQEVGAFIHYRRSILQNILSKTSWVIFSDEEVTSVLCAPAQKLLALFFQENGITFNFS